MTSNLYRKVLTVLLQNLMRVEHFEFCTLKFKKLGDWDFRISDLVKNSDGNDI